jgi:anti-sigma regulatory factor (Ser/Thr protein kinase)
VSTDPDPPGGTTTELRRDRIPAVADFLGELRHTLIAWARRTPLNPGQIEDLALAVHEAMTNVVIHAYPDESGGTFDLRATHNPRDGTVAVTVTDRGHWHAPNPRNRPFHGRGLKLIRALAAHATVNATPQGTTVRMLWAPSGYRG